ncbi:MAG TPA: hypothetical protein VNY07_10185 [Chthoniobacterales bacterium]|nr:hypothetical protein [Chthoniobacterales bacterium]
MIEFFLHGYGSSAGEFRLHWGPNVSAQNSFFLDGPQFDRLTSKRRWFPFSAQPAVVQRGLGIAVGAAERQIEVMLQSIGHGITTEIALVGHSQGAMVVYEVLHRQRFNVSAARCYAGFLPRSQFRPIRAARSSISLSIYSSTIDLYIDPLEVKYTVLYFRKIPGIDVTHYQTSQLTHGFSSGWLDSRKFEIQ